MDSLLTDAYSAAANESSPSDSGNYMDDGAPLSATSPNADSPLGERPKTGDSHQSPTANGNDKNHTSAQLPHGLNPRSCVTCRKRKVKCDKSHPCSNCKRAGIECIFPKPGRAPRRSKKAPDSELLARLRRLEGVVSKMGKGPDGEDIVESPVILHSGSSDGNNSVAGPITPASIPAPPTFEKPATTQPELLPHGVHQVTREMGRLVVEQGKSRYVSNKFWAQLTEELAELQELLDVDEASGDEAVDDHGSSPGSSSKSSEKHTHQEFIFGYSSLMATLRMLHPHPRQIMTYWALYKENIDPVLRLIHKPTVEMMFIQATNDLNHLTKTNEALMFAIYLTVVTSLSTEECRTRLDVDKDVALARYRYATEQALARAGFVETQELRLLQAAMLFVSAVRRFDGTSFVWAMTGLMIRIGQRQGLHRDGSHFNLSPFDTEERRRLWWQLSTFDGRVSDDQGIDPMVFQMNFDTKIPLNVNDEDIWPGMTEWPQERERPTDMVFDLTRYEIGSTIRALKIGMRQGASVEHRDRLIDQLRERLESKYLRYCDMSVPLEWVTVNICRLVLAKIWLMAHYPLNFSNGHAKASDELRHRTFIKSVDIIRYTRLLETQHKTLKWGWMFRTYSQWHAAAFAFDELRRRTAGAEVEEAWRVMDEAFAEWQNPSSGYTKSILWKPITRLRAMAKEARQKDLQQRQMFPQDGTIGRSTSLSGPSLDAPMDLRPPESWKGNCPMGKPPPEPITNVMTNPAPDFKPTMTMTAEAVMPGMDNIGTPNMPMITDDSTFQMPSMSMNGYDQNGTNAFGAGPNGWLIGDPDVQVPNWMDDAEMSWDELNAIVSSHPIHVNESAMWGDPGNLG